METIDVESAQELSWGYSTAELEYVAKQEQSKHRWYDRHLVVFKQGDSLLGFYYDEPATEEQEGMETFENDPVPVFPVTAMEVKTVLYAPVDSGETVATI